jgi:hypothetical protein
MTILFKMISSIMVSLFFVSCVTSGNNKKISDKESDVWQIHDFRIVKVRLQAPKDINWSETAIYGDPLLEFELLPVKPPIGIIDDTYYRIKITITRTTKEVLQNKRNKIFISDLFKRGKAQAYLWAYEIHPQTERYDDQDYSYYRKDVVSDDEHILSAHVEVLNLKRISNEERIQEDIIVRRILDSIELLPDRL